MKISSIEQLLHVLGDLLIRGLGVAEDLPDGNVTAESLGVVHPMPIGNPEVGDSERRAAPPGKARAKTN